MLKLYFTLAVFVILSKNGSSQNVTFDIFSFPEPTGFSKLLQPGFVTYSISNDAKGNYCMILLGSSSAGSGNLQKDFNNQWEKIAKPFNPKTKPEEHKGDTLDGWKMLTGVSTFNKEGTPGILILSTYSSKNQCASIMYLLNDTAFQKVLDDFSNQITINNSSLNPNSVSQNSNSTASGNISYTAPNGWSSLPNITTGAGFISPLLECTDNSIYKLYILPTTNFTGSLQEYARQMHKAYFYQANNPYLSYKEAEKRIVKGNDDKGREYLSYETPAHSFDDNTWHYGMVYLLKSGSDLAAFIVELNPIDRNKFSPPTSVYNFIDACPPLKTVWKKFLSSIIFTNSIPAKTIVPAELEGTWTSRVHLGWTTLAGQYAVENSQVVEKYTFNDNGTYVKDEFAKGKTKGTFSISGNKINFTEASGKKYSYPFTLTSTFEYSSWQRALSFYDANRQEIKLNYETVQ